MQRGLFILVTVMATMGFARGQDPESSSNRFALVDDFAREQSRFEADTFEVRDLSTDGGELVVYYSREKDYLVFDVWLYGETGKSHTIFWTDRKRNLRVIQRNDYTYDRPYYEPGFKAIEDVQYIIYDQKRKIRFDNSRKELLGADVQVTAKCEELFREVGRRARIRQ